MTTTRKEGYVYGGGLLRDELVNAIDALGWEGQDDSARQNANDTVRLTAHEHALTKTDPKLYNKD